MNEQLEMFCERCGEEPATHLCEYPYDAGEAVCTLCRDNEAEEEARYRVVTPLPESKSEVIERVARERGIPVTPVTLLPSDFTYEALNGFPIRSEEE